MMLVKLVEAVFKKLETMGIYCCCDGQVYILYYYDNQEFLEYRHFGDYILKTSSFLNRPNIKKQLSDFLLHDFEFEYSGEDFETLFLRLYGFLNPGIKMPTRPEVKLQITAGIRNITGIIKEVCDDIIVTKDNNTFLNVYKVSPVMKAAKSMAPIKFKFGVFKYLEDNCPHIWDFLTVFLARDDDEENIPYILNHLSYFLQNLGKGCVMVHYYLVGAEGTGKSMFVSKILFPLFNDGLNGSMGDAPDVVTMEKGELERFNERIVNKYVVFFDEIKGDKEIIRKIKNMVANETIPVEGKNRKAYSVKNNALYVFSKNDMHRDGILDSGDNRRFTICYNNTSLNNVWGIEKAAWWNLEFAKSEDYQRELVHFCYFLINYDFNLKLAMYPQQNEIRNLLKDVSKEDDGLYNLIKEILLQGVSQAYQFNYVELSSESIKNIYLFYDAKNRSFILHRSNFLRILSERIPNMKKSKMISYIFEKFGFKYMNPSGTKVTTYKGINAMLLKLQTKNEIFEAMSEEYNRLIKSDFQ